MRDLIVRTFALITNLCKRRRLAVIKISDDKRKFKELREH